MEGSSPFEFDPFVLVASSAASTSARLIAHPLDTLRIRIQTHPASLPPPKLAKLLSNPLALYRGLPVSLTLGVPALSVYLLSYELAKSRLRTILLPSDRTATVFEQIPVFMLSGVAAEVASGFLWTPLDVLKSRLQTGEGTSAIRLTQKIVAQEGLKGLYRGYLLSLAVYCPYLSLYWTNYELLKMSCIPGYDGYANTIPASTSATSGFSIPVTARYTLCSVTACAVSASIVTPLELINSKWQTSGGMKGGISIGGIVREVWKDGGARAFTRGLGMRVAYAIPANGISMTIYESLKRWKGI